MSMCPRVSLNWYRCEVGNALCCESQASSNYPRFWVASLSHSRLTYNHMVSRFTEPQLDRIFQALSAATRRDIVRRTLDGARSVSELAADYEMSFAAVQKHVAVLERAGLVAKTVQGRERMVRAVPQQIARARQALEQFEAIWRHRMQGLDALLVAENSPDSQE